MIFLGKHIMFYFQSYVDATPEMLFDIFVTNVVDWPKWNPTMLDCKVRDLQDIRL